jgi:hypothetical protein
VLLNDTLEADGGSSGMPFPPAMVIGNRRKRARFHSADDAVGLERALPRAKASPCATMMETLILTLRMGDREATYFNRLRRAHFLAERNFIDAHLTIFHYLPAAECIAIERALAAATVDTAPL